MIGNKAILTEIDLKEKKKRVDKYYEDIIRDHDISEYIITIENQDDNIVKAIKMHHPFITVIINFFNNKLDIKIRGSIQGMKIHTEIMNDLNTCLHAAKFAYYKNANSQLRNIMENIFKLIYFKQHPEDFEKYGKREKYISMTRPFKQKVKFKDDKIFYEFADKLSAYVHSSPKHFNPSITGVNKYRAKHFIEWFDNFKKTIEISTKTLES